MHMHEIVNPSPSFYRLKLFQAVRPGVVLRHRAGHIFQVCEERATMAPLGLRICTLLKNLVSTALCSALMCV